MPNPYADRYKNLSVDFKKVEGKRKKGREAAQGRADWMGLAGSVAPVLGTGIGTAIGAGVGSMAGGVGAIPGAAIGGALGGAAGGIVGGGANFAADQQTQPYDEEEARRRARYEAVNSILGNMRR